MGLSGMINQFVYKLQVIGIIVALICAVAGGIAFYYFKVRKRNRLKEEMVDYSSFDRRNSSDYINIDDIKDDMIILENGYRFVGVLKCRGYDFGSAHAIEQSATVSSFLGFINTINKPITYRQYSKSVDLEYTYKMYQDAYDKLVEEMFLVVEDLKDLELNLKRDKDNLSDKEVSLYMESKKELEDRIGSYEFRKYHMENQMQYISNVSGNKVSPDINETWVFDWTFDPLAFSVELTEEEVFERAKQELNAIAQAKIHSLSNSGVKASRCNTVDLIEMCRRYSSPISSDRYKIGDVLRSTYFFDIATSTSPNDIIQEGFRVVREESQEYISEQLHELSIQLNAEQELEELRIRSDELESSLLEELTLHKEVENTEELLTNVQEVDEKKKSLQEKRNPNNKQEFRKKNHSNNAKDVIWGG